MYKTRKKVIFLAVDAVILVLFVFLSMILLPSRLKDHSFILLGAVPAAVFIILLIDGEAVRNAVTSMVYSRIFDAGETKYLTQFINRLRFCYSLDDLSKAVSDVLELVSDCSVMFVDCEKNYILYNSPEFLHNLPFYGVAVVCKDDPVIKELLPKIGRTTITYGSTVDCDVQIFEFKQENNHSLFKIRRKDGSILDIKLNLPGYHMALNAAAAIAVASEDEISDESIINALANFKGVGRRFEQYGEFDIGNGKVMLVDDYGHHPSEVRATINAVRAGWPNRRLVMIFQPHRYTRTRDCFEEFINVLGLVDELILMDVYPAGEEPIVGADGRALCRSIRLRGKVEPYFVSTPNEVPSTVAQIIRDGDILLTQGAGNVGHVAKVLAEYKLDLEKMKDKV